MLFWPFIVLTLFTSGLKSLEVNKVNTILFESGKVYIAPESKMYFTGSTSIKNFKCKCLTVDNAIPLSMVYKDQKVHFNNTSLKINSKNIDCNHKLYNNNIKKSLESDKYSNITIDLQEAWKIDDYYTLNESDWFDVMSVTYLTIKQTTKRLVVRGKAIKIAKNKYRILGTQTVSMNDFNINPPEILFGLISFGDKINFHFDLDIEIIK